MPGGPMYMMNVLRRRSTVFTAACLTVLASVSVACGDSDEAAEVGGPVTTAAEPAEETTTTASETAQEQAAGGAGNECGSNLDELISAAQQEGQVFFYTVPGANLAQNLGEAFSAEYGVDFEFVRMTTPDTAARLTAEDEAGAVVADLALITATDIFPALMEQGIFVRLDEAIPNYPEILPQQLPAQFVKDDWGTAIPLSRPAVIAYNTDLVSEDEVPQSHEDLADPRWAGEVMTVNPMESSSYLDSFYQFMNLYGEEFIVQLVDNGLKFAGSAAPATQALGAGEVSIFFGAPSGQALVLQEEGAPVDWVVPDVTTGSDTVIGIVEGAPHPCAGRLLAYFLLTEEGAGTLIEAEGDASPFEGELPPGYEVYELEDIPKDDQERIFEILGLR